MTSFIQHFGDTGREVHVAGFTLLELLAGLVVLGFILLGLAQGVEFGVRAGTMQATLIDKRADLDSADRTLRGLVARMDPGSLNRPPQVVGERGQVSFTTDLPSGVANVLTRHVDVEISVDLLHRLMLRWRPHLHSKVPNPAPYASEATLLTGVDAVEFSYLFPPGTGSSGWSDTWTYGFLPALVRVHLRSQTATRKDWPDIVARPAEDRPRA